MGKFRFVEAFRGDLNKNSNYRGFRIIEVRISEVLLHMEENMALPVPIFSRISQNLHFWFQIRVVGIEVINILAFRYWPIWIRGNIIRDIPHSRD